MLIEPDNEIIDVREVEKRLAQIEQVLQAKGGHPCLERSREGTKFPIELSHDEFKPLLSAPFKPPIFAANLLNTTDKGIHPGFLHLYLVHLLQRLAGEYWVEPEQVLDQPKEGTDVAGRVELLAEQRPVAGNFSAQALLGLTTGLLGVAMQQGEHREGVGRTLQQRWVKVAQRKNRE